jgi:hypothetical protein
MTRIRKDVNDYAQMIMRKVTKEATHHEDSARNSHFRFSEANLPDFSVREPCLRNRIQ